MKKMTLLFAAIIMLVGASVSANAQGLIVKGGLSYSNVAAGFNLPNVEAKNYTGWHFGLGVQTDTFMGFSLQPELIYNVKGAQFNDLYNWKMSYLELPVNIQWGIDLLVARPFIMVSPFLGYSLSNKLYRNGNATLDAALENVIENAKRIEYGLGIGAGINVWKLQISAKYNWNFGNVASAQDYINSVKDLGRNATNFEVSLGLRF